MRSILCYWEELLIAWTVLYVWDAFCTSEGQTAAKKWLEKKPRSSRGRIKGSSLRAPPTFSRCEDENRTVGVPVAYIWDRATYRDRALAYAEEVYRSLRVWSPRAWNAQLNKRQPRECDQVAAGVLGWQDRFSRLDSCISLGCCVSGEISSCT